MAIDPNASNFDIDLSRALNQLHGRSQAQQALAYLAGNPGLATAPEGDVVGAMGQLRQWGNRFPVPYTPPPQFDPQLAQMGLQQQPSRYFSTLPTPSAPPYGPPIPAGGAGSTGPQYFPTTPESGPFGPRTLPANLGKTGNNIANVLSGLPGEAGATSEVSNFAKAGGLLGKLGLGTNTANAEALGGLGKYINPSLFNEAGALSKVGLATRGLGYTGAGLGADTLIRQILPGQSNAENVLGRTAAGAGIGAGIGSILPGPGTLLGGLVGGTAGALSTLLNHKPKGNDLDEAQNKLESAISASGLSSQLADPIRAQFNVAYQLAPDKATKQAVLTGMGQTISDAIGQQQQLTQDQDAMLASQAMLQQFIAPVRNNIMSSAVAQKSNLQNILPGIPPEQRAGLLAQADNNISIANRLAGAYSQQMLSQPSLAALQLQQQRLGQVGNTQFSQAIQQQLSGGAAGTNAQQQLLQGG